jgi:hypothetical protein
MTNPKGNSQQFGRAARLEARIRMLTTEVNGQYPRPWMTTACDPSACEIFIVGRNQRNAYQVEQVGSHEYFINTLFNRGGETCRSLYDRMTSTPSPTRGNIDRLTRALKKHTNAGILETNVVCYSTPMSADLLQDANDSGASRGREIFLTLWEVVRPRIIIAHGSGTVKELGKLFRSKLPSPPADPCPPVSHSLNSADVFIIPSLAPPAYNRWHSWADEHFSELSIAVAERLIRKPGLERGAIASSLSQDH